jgi:hypothetical protein
MWGISAVTGLATVGRLGTYSVSKSFGGVMSEIAVTELGDVGLGVRDLSRCRVLVGEGLGMECVEAGDNLHLRMDYWNCRIRLHPDAPSITVSVNSKRGGVRRLDRPKDPLDQIRRAHPEAAWTFLPSPAAAAGPIGAAGGEAVPDFAIFNIPVCYLY